MKRLTRAMVAGTFSLASSALAGDTIYAIDNDASSDKVGYFDSDAPGTFTPLGESTGEGGFINGLEFDGIGTLYGSNGSRLFIVADDGSTTGVGSHGLGTRTIGGMSWDPTTNTMWGIENDPFCGFPSNLVVIDRTTGEASVVCAHPLATCAVGLAVDSSGNGYVQDVADDAIHVTDLGACTVSNSQTLNYDANFGQEITINNTTGDGYIVAFNNTNFIGEFWSWEPATGAHTYISDLGGTNLTQMAGADVDEAGGVQLVPYPFMTLDGECPGLVDITVEHCTPQGTVALLYSTELGNFTVPNNKPCAGTQLNLRQPKVTQLRSADDEGVATFSGQVPGGLCGELFLQAVDLASCQVSGVTPIPQGQGVVKKCEWRLVCILEENSGACATAVWDAIANWPDKFVFENAQCSANSNCRNAGQTVAVTVKVRYRDGASEEAECMVDVKLRSTGRCVFPVAVPFQALSVISDPPGCHPNYIFE